MNRKQRRMAQKRGVAVPKDPVYNIKRSDINSMKEQAVSDAADAAMVLLLALPIKVLRDEYGWGTKKRLPEFADKLTEDIEKARWYLDYVQHDIERDGGATNNGYVPEEVVKMYYRLNDLYIDITDKIANQGGEV